MKCFCFYISWLSCLFFLFGACRPFAEEREADSLPPIYPDYCNVTIPPNIAPLNFLMRDDAEQVEVKLKGKKIEYTYISNNGKVQFPQTDWQEMLEREQGATIQVTIRALIGNEWVVYRPFKWEITYDTLDAYLLYNSISPDQLSDGGQWRERHIETFHERKLPGKYRFKEAKPYFSPGRYIAFATCSPDAGLSISSDDFWVLYGKNSSLYLFDKTQKELREVSDSLAGKMTRAYPVLSPDGKWLYYCEAPSFDPDSLNDWRFSLYRTAFNLRTGRCESPMDTLYEAKAKGHTVTYLSLSPDGHDLLYTLSSYGMSPDWQQEADLQRMILPGQEIDSLQVVNSDAFDGQPFWASDGRWFVFNSKRGDKLYGKPYFCYVDSAGVAHKPFLLPQRDPAWYDYMLRSMDSPILVTQPVDTGIFAVLEQQLNNENIKP